MLDAKPRHKNRVDGWMQCLYNHYKLMVNPKMLHIGALKEYQLTVTDQQMHVPSKFIWFAKLNQHQDFIEQHFILLNMPSSPVLILIGPNN